MKLPDLKEMKFGTLVISMTIGVFVGSIIYEMFVRRDVVGFYDADKALANHPSVKEFQKINDAYLAGYNALRAATQAELTKYESATGIEKDSIKAVLTGKETEMKAFAEKANLELDLQRQKVNRDVSPMLDSIAAVIAKEKGLDILLNASTLRADHSVLKGNDFTEQIKAKIK